MPGDPTVAIRQLDGPALDRLAYELGLAPEYAYLWPGVPGEPDLPYANREFWEPHRDLAAARVLFFDGLRARGWTVSVVYFNDHRQYGDAWCATAGRAWGVQWPVEAKTEAEALTRCAVLAVASQEQEKVS